MHDLDPLARFLRRLCRHRLHPGAPVVYRTATPRRNQSSDKYWRVEQVRADGTIIARNSLMEKYVLRPNDPNLRRAGLLEQLRHGGRFPYLA